LLFYFYAALYQLGARLQLGALQVQVLIRNVQIVAQRIVLEVGQTGVLVQKNVEEEIVFVRLTLTNLPLVMVNRVDSLMVKPILSHATLNHARSTVVVNGLHGVVVVLVVVVVLAHVRSLLHNLPLVAVKRAQLKMANRNPKHATRVYAL